MRPLIEPGSHPVEKMEYVLPTPSINGLSDFVQQSLKINLGGMVPGWPRIGKSSAIKYLQGELQENSDTAYPVFIVEAEDRKPSRKAFFGTILTGIDHDIKSGDEEVRKKRILNFLFESAEKAKVNKIIFFVDEAQNWHRTELTWLCEIWNALDRKEIHLITFLVGDLDLFDNRNALKKIRAMKVVNRFMARTYEFHGLDELADIEYVLGCYDDDSEFPKGSGYSYTRYFCEEVFDSGWRLRIEALKIWNAFQEIRKKKKVDVIDEIPMVFMARTVEQLLLRTRLHNSAYRYKDIKLAVELSGYAEGSDYLVQPEIKQGK